MKKSCYLLFYLFVIGGLSGFLYEEIFYYFDLGYLVKRGSTFGPWIPIYGFGSLLIYYLCRSFNGKYRSLLVFWGSFFATGLLEYGTGYVLLTVFHTRLWDYNVEILNFGNINGFVCLRSVLLFAFGGLFLVYRVVPFIEKHLLKGWYPLVGAFLFGLFVFDILLHLVL